MCHKHSFVVTRDARVFQGHGITDSHSSIAELWHLNEDNLRKYEAQPGEHWPENPRDWHIVDDSGRNPPFEEKQSHSTAIMDYLVQRFPTRESWDVYPQDWSGLLPTTGSGVDELLKRLKTIAWFSRSSDHREDVARFLADHLTALKRFGAGPNVHVKWITSWAAARDDAWAAARDAAWDAARDAARDAAWVAARVAARDAAWVAAWVAARDAARDAAWAAQYLVVADLVDWPNPWAPLIDIYALGYWPIGVVDGEYIIFEPPMQGGE